MMDLVSNLEGYICQKHESPLELFCKDDQTIVCLLCAVKEHMNYNMVSMDMESKEK
ncbi:hypothetical protein M9458_038693, partial [Cirrhinus mrigala]